MSNSLFALRTAIAQSAMARRFAGAAAWSVLGAVVSSGINMTLMMMVARILPQDKYGQLILLQSTLMSVSLLAGLGMSAVATRYTAALRSREPERLARILALCIRMTLLGSVIAMLSLLLWASPVATGVLSSVDLYVPVLLSAPSVLFLTLDLYQKSVLIGLESMKLVALSTLAGVLLSLPTMLFLTHQYGLEGAATALSAAAFYQVLFSYLSLRHERVRHDLSRNTAHWRGERSLLGSYALPALIAGGLVGPAHWAVQAILAGRPDGFTQIAILGIAMQWFNVIMFIPGNASKVVLPILTDSLTGNDHKGSRSLLGFSILANALIAIPLAIGMSLFATQILQLYGDSYNDSTLPFRLAVFTAAILACIGPIGTMMSAASRMWLAASTNAAWAALYVGLVYLLFGDSAAGVTQALIIAYVFHTIWTILFARVHLRQIANATAHSATQAPDK
ncbi:oligosaccharide flippase family protein [Granulosicoccus antarcticus]|uniref:Polysaccharide biosynthesis protein C-terminal domain-containing protein n=1 Tax=Granulosicoccus antarcticus IMCC3135 TaxID=1192854 RepID=A0A2Z2NVG7_9GAMM|nr:oligosaccharide flippase family protein [Granulosicoccus antarcticus]ASJ74505.1 hypothetical protein IMCC3135_22170 [Granulosicoccus antarcticus IMCC3135]